MTSPLRPVSTSDPETSPQPTGYLRYAREVRAGWWLRFGGTIDVDTLDVEFGVHWLRVTAVEVLPPDEDDHTIRRRRITFANGEVVAPMATADVIALTARQAKAAGFTDDPPSRTDSQEG